MLSDSYVKKGFERDDELEEERKAKLLEEMGLEDRDVKKLQAMQLSHEEAIIAKEEELERIRVHKGRKEDWEEFVDAKRRMGRVLPHAEFFSRLKQVVPRLIVAQGGQKNRVGLYVTRNVPAEEIPDYRGNWHYVEAPIYVGWADIGELPEYEIDLVNDVGVAIGQKRGWRTTLLRLMCRRHRCAACSQGERPRPLGCGINGCGRPTPLVSELAVERAFGYPTNGATASNYRRQLWEFRNGLR